MVKRTVAPDVTDATVKSETVKAAAPAGPAVDIDAVLTDLNKHAQSSEHAASTAEAKQVQQEVDKVEAGILKLLALIAKPARMVMPYLTDDQFEQLWGTQFQKNLAEPAAEICRDAGWDLSGTLGKASPYIGLGAAIVPSLIVTIKVHREAKAYYAEQAAKGETTAGQGNGSAT